MRIRAPDHRTVQCVLVAFVWYGGRQLGKGHLNIVKPRELILTR
jgi:hypothetical protein